MSSPPRLPAGIDAALDRLVLLTEPVRRRVFAHLSSSSRGASREETAAAVGIDLPLATFHLERLVDGGLVDAGQELRTPGERHQRGRPRKRYRARDIGLELSLPARDYRAAAELFADVLGGMERPTALDDAAYGRGRSIGRQARGRRRSADLTKVLVDRGYAPEAEPAGRICLRNCPFDALARTHRDVVCPTNLSLLTGIVDGTGSTGSVRPVLDPAPGRCCVVLETTGERADLEMGEPQAARHG